ncbi:hypothetical protein IWX81_000324 [Salinibacterium sp. CAN_S4]|uniref:hypothetical protein n=1 Tax=Salinibacterium sp. CAN_S4 TaxID=2787727 RepID=UPI0018EF95C1
MRNSIRSVALAVASCALAVVLLAGCTTTITVPLDATDSDVDAYVASQLDRYWKQILAGSTGANGIDPEPDVSTVEFTTPDTWSTVQTSCLQAAGLQAREISGGFTIDDPGDLDATEVSLAQWTCLRQYPVDPRITGFLSDEQVMFMYDYFTTRLAPCIATLGFDVTPPPTRDQYLGLVRGGSAWSPYVRADGNPIARSPGEWALVNGKCPPLPDDPFGSYRPEESQPSTPG